MLKIDKPPKRVGLWSYVFDGNDTALNGMFMVLALLLFVKIYFCD